MTSAVSVVKGVDATKQGLGGTVRRPAKAGQPGKDVLIGNVEERLEGTELLGGHFGKLRIGEAAEEEVDLAHAAMPRAKAQPLAADGELVFRIGHHRLNEMARGAGPISA